MIIPAGVILLVASLVFAGGDRSKPTRRYRPGRPYDFQPVWFLASPEQAGGATAGSEGHHARPAIEAGILEDATGARVRPGPTGGASDSW